ncbi:aldo/keto reductase [Clostridia bacterium]|nr:aldo/keto reductase [Clostridia bacterium]
MEKRTFEKLGVSASLLGFGCMRFPMQGDGEIDEAAGEQMLTEAYEAGVNYFDTAYPYHNGKSEPFVGKVLNKFKRDSYYLATKLPVWFVKKEEDVRRIFEEQLQRLDKDYVDFYLLHALNAERLADLVDCKVIETCEQLKKEGKIKYLGFSFHDSYEAFEKIAKLYPWDFCQIQYNYMDTDFQAGDKGYALTEELDIPVVVMEPIRGGSLANHSKEILTKFRSQNPDATPSSYALRWVASHPNVKVVLSGMSSLAQMRDNLATFSDFKPLNEQEREIIDEVASILKSRVQNACTACGYCMPCPAKVNIPMNFKAWNDYHTYQSYGAIKFLWEVAIGEESKAKNCVECGKCEKSCPQGIAIRADLKRVQEDLTVTS